MRSPGLAILLGLRLGIVLVAAACGAPAARAEPASTWMPLRPGTRWSYALHADHTYRPSAGSIDRTFRRGEVERERLARSPDADGAIVRVREVRTERPVGVGGVPASRQQSVTEYGAGDELSVHAFVLEPGGASRFTPPLRMLPAEPAPGSRWRVGTWRSAGAQVELAGEVLGIAEIEEGGRRFPKALRVRYAGPISGTTPVASGPATIRNGEVAREVWLAPGVGIVREVTTTQAELELPEGAGTARIEEVVTLRLVDGPASP